MWALWPLIQVDPVFAFGCFQLHFPQLPSGISKSRDHGEPQTLQRVLLRILYVRDFRRTGCYCFLISCPLSLKMQAQGSIPFCQQRCFPVDNLPFFPVLARNKSLIEFHLSKLWQNDG